MYADSAEVEDVLRKLSNPRRKLKGCTLTVERWPEVSELLLHGFEESVTKEVLEAYFRNEKISGCRTLVDVTMKGRGIAIVTLQGSQGKETNYTDNTIQHAILPCYKCNHQLLRDFMHKIQLLHA